MASKVYNAVHKLIEQRCYTTLFNRQYKFSLFTGFNYFGMYWRKYGFDRRRNGK